MTNFRTAKYLPDGTAIDDPNKVTDITSAQAAILTAPGALSGITYDTNNRAVAWNIDGIAYTASYSGSEIVVAGSDGTITRITLDPAARITGVVTA